MGICKKNAPHNCQVTLLENNNLVYYNDNKWNKLELDRRYLEIDTNNKKFDPNFHQAMSEIEDDKTDPGTILNEIQSGYMLGDRLLRPSLVGISKKKTSKDQENSDKKKEN